MSSFSPPVPTVVTAYLPDGSPLTVAMPPATYRVSPPTTTLEMPYLPPRSRPATPKELRAAEQVQRLILDKPKCDCIEGYQDPRCTKPMKNMTMLEFANIIFTRPEIKKVIKEDKKANEGVKKVATKRLSTEAPRARKKPKTPTGGRGKAAAAAGQNRVRRPSSPLGSAGSTEGFSGGSGEEPSSASPERTEDNPAADPAAKSGGKEEITCFCGKPYNNRPMVECTVCLDWYHVKCVKIDLEFAKKSDYMCYKCNGGELPFVLEEGLLKRTSTGRRRTAPKRRSIE